MKLLCCVLLPLLLLGSCKSAEKAMFKMPSNRLSSQLPPLEVTVESGALDLTEGAWPDDPRRVFEQEVSENIAEHADTARFGYANLLVTEAEVKRTGKLFQGIQMITLMLPSLLALPVEYYRTKVKAEVQILNARGDTLGIYSGTGRSKVRVAMYHGFSQSEAPRLSDVQALRLALDQIRPQLETEADSLRKLLLAAGPLPNSPVSFPADLPANTNAPADSLSTEAPTPPAPGNNNAESNDGE